MRAHTTDYSDRQIDVELMQTVSRPSGVTPLDLAFTTTDTRAVTGMQKMAQRYTVLLLTQLADVHFAQDQGTDFWRDMLRGAAQNRGQVTMAFNFSSIDAVAQMQADDGLAIYGTIPDDERIVSATLTDFDMNIATATLYLRVLLTSRAGDTYTYVLPTTVARR
jgi:hypothetical protein